MGSADSLTRPGHLRCAATSPSLLPGAPGAHLAGARPEQLQDGELGEGSLQLIHESGAGGRCPGPPPSRPLVHRMGGPLVGAPLVGSSSGDTSVRGALGSLFVVKVHVSEVSSMPGPQPLIGTLEVVWGPPASSGLIL